MYTLRRFISYCAVLAALAFLDTTSLELNTLAPRMNMHGLATGTDEFLQTVFNDARLSSQSTVTELTPKLKFIINNAGMFAQHNVVKARLQFVGMVNNIPARFTLSYWLPKGAPNWMKGGAQQAVQKAGDKANDLAKKVPVVDQAINSTTSRDRAARDSLSNAASF